MTFVFAAGKRSCNADDWVVPVVVVVVARTANRAEQPKSNAPVALAANTNDDDDAFFDSLLRPLKRSAFSSSDKEEDEKGSEEGTAIACVCAKCACIFLLLLRFLESSDKEEDFCRALRDATRSFARRRHARAFVSARRDFDVLFQGDQLKKVGVFRVC